MNVPQRRVERQATHNRAHVSGDTVAPRARLCKVLIDDDPGAGLATLVHDGFFCRWIPAIVDMQMEQDPDCSPHRSWIVEGG